MAAIRVNEETETARGWEFEVRVESDAPERVRRVRLSWQDYDLWGRGAVPPARVARAIVQVLLKAGVLDEMGETFDASSARRLVRSLDTDVPEELTD